MCAAVGVVFYPVYRVLPRQVTLVVDNAYTPLVSATSVPDCDFSRVVPSSQVLPLPRNGELDVRPPLPQVVIDGPLEVPQAVGAGLVGAQRNELVLSGVLGLHNAAVHGDGGRDGRLGGLLEGVGSV